MTRKGTPTLIEATLHGETQPDQNPDTPREPDEIIRDFMTCLDAGASQIMHRPKAVPGL